jgi:hypothetical protein
MLSIAVLRGNHGCDWKTNTQKVAANLFDRDRDRIYFFIGTSISSILNDYYIIRVYFVYNIQKMSYTYSCPYHKASKMMFGFSPRSTLNETTLAVYILCSTFPF